MNELYDVTEKGNGAGRETRTPDLRITNALLYQLSYSGNEGVLSSKPGITSRTLKQLFDGIQSLYCD